jgi:hypothetical protein
MDSGFYVVRMPKRGIGSRLMIESICFKKHPKDPTISDAWVRQQADSWCDFVQGQHPKDDVFVMECFEKESE